MKIHGLKTWPSYFQAIKNGDKTFEVRKNDRGFEVGDRLVLMEFDPGKNRLTGSMVHAKITWILSENPFIDLGGHVILAIKIYGKQ